MMFELLMTTGLAAALMAGVFFTFSSFVMPALDNVDPSMAIAAMKRINIDVFCFSFGILFFGIPIASLAIGVCSVTQWSAPWAIHALIGSAVYLVGSLLVTIAGNVPLNDKLARVTPTPESAAADWLKFTIPWVRYNHLRTIASTAAALAFLLAAIAVR